MIVKRRSAVLLSGTLLSASLAVAAPAFADDAQNEQLQRQIDAMQQQLQKMQAQLAETKKEAKTATQAVQNIPGGVYDSAGKPGTGSLFKAPALPPGVKVTFGGFIEAAAVWREHNEVADVNSSPFGSMPFPNSPLYHEGEFRGSARQSRFSIKATGDIDPAKRLTAYYEMDFLGAGVTANSRESNSYQPRIRQAFVGYDDDNYHFHLSAGQTWSLATQNKVGMLPLTENTPLVIDAQNVVGFDWARQPGIRFVEDFNNKTIWLGMSVESPQVNFASNSIGVVGGLSQGATSGGLTGSTNAGSPIPPGLSINDLNACQASGLLDSATACSTDEFPDLIQKAAFDPGWGHYEVFGMERFFTDRVYTTAIQGSGSNKTNTGWGIGGSALMPVVPKYVDFQASVLTGEGIGRYGSSQLADVTIGPDGSLTPLRATHVLLGAIGHVTPDLDVYAYAGQEQVQANFYNIGATPFGYGNSGYANTGCLLENQGSGTAGYNDPIAGTTCTANVHRTQELTVGFWNNLYKGSWGRLTYGVQYEFLKLQAFAGAPGPTTATSTPNQGLSPTEQAVMVSLRYYPF